MPHLRSWGIPPTQTPTRDPYLTIFTLSAVGAYRAVSFHFVLGDDDRPDGPAENASNHKNVSNEENGSNHKNASNHTNGTNDQQGSGSNHENGSNHEKASNHDYKAPAENVLDRRGARQSRWTGEGHAILGQGHAPAPIFDGQTMVVKSGPGAASLARHVPDQVRAPSPLQGYLAHKKQRRPRTLQ